jgi:hypothetical protein
MTKINDSVSVGAELAARITRMNEMLGGECPYVKGSVTRYCTLTPFTLTDAEREAVEWFATYGYSSDGVPGRNAATLQGLLERTRKVTR